MDQLRTARAPGPGRGEGAALACLVALLLLLVLWGAAWARRRGRHAVRHARPMASRVDGRPYRVHRDHPNPQRAADLLAALNARAAALLRALEARYAREASTRAPARRAAALRLISLYRPGSLAESSPFNSAGDTSFTLGDGAVVALCLRERAGPGARFHDLETLTFVALHELAHLAAGGTGHPPAFWSTFRFLLEEAEKAGVYSGPDFAESPRPYCGVRIDYDPRFDPGVRPL